jgi:hypothetical protein
MRQHRSKTRLILPLCEGAIVLALVSAAAYVAWAHVRYGLILATSITIDAPDRVQAGAPYDIEVFVDGYPLGAGVAISVEGSWASNGVEPVARGPNIYRAVAPSAPGYYDLTGHLFAVPSGNPGICGVFGLSRPLLIPPSDMCFYTDLSRARDFIKVVDDTQIKDEPAPDTPATPHQMIFEDPVPSQNQ